MNNDCVFRSCDCVFHDKSIFTFFAMQITTVHRRVSMLSYINSVFSQSHTNYYATGQILNDNKPHDRCISRCVHMDWELGNHEP